MNEELLKLTGQYESKIFIEVDAATMKKLDLIFKYGGEIALGTNAKNVNDIKNVKVKGTNQIGGDAGNIVLKWLDQIQSKACDGTHSSPFKAKQILSQIYDMADVMIATVRVSEDDK